MCSKTVYFKGDLLSVNNYWKKVWAGAEVEDYKKYIDLNGKCQFIEIFKQNNLLRICDAACGFGKYSAIISKNNFDVSGFDISEEAVNLTRNMLTEMSLKFEDFCVCSIMKINYKDESFDGVVAHAVIDHFITKQAYMVLDELFRITKNGGLIYLSFDGLEDNDIETVHETLEDGSFKYTNGCRKGMIFKYYNDDEINKLFAGREIIYFNTKVNGEREVILKKK